MTPATKTRLMRAVLSALLIVVCLMLIHLLDQFGVLG